MAQTGAILQIKGLLVVRRTDTSLIVFPSNPHRLQPNRWNIFTETSMEHSSVVLHKKNVNSIRALLMQACWYIGLPC